MASPTSNHDKHVKSAGEEIIASILPLLKLITLTLFGLILSHRKIQFIPRQTFKLLSKLVFVLFLPCLIFTNLGQSVTIHNVVDWWFIPVNVVVSTAAGCILGCIVAVVCRPPPQFFRFTVIATGFGNTGNIAYAVVGTICRRSSGNPFGPDCYSNGVAYASIAQWVSVILVYTLVYHMMEPPLEYYEVIREEEEDDGGGGGGREIIEVVEDSSTASADLSRPLLVEAEWPGIETQLETEHSKTPFIARLFNLSGISDIDVAAAAAAEAEVEAEVGGGRAESPKSIKCMAEPRVVRKMRVVAEQTPINHILQPPTIASLLALVIGVIQPLKGVVYGADAPLGFITDSLTLMAEAAVPSVMLVLGGMLAEGPNESSLGVRTTVGIVVARLLVLPAVGIGVVKAAEEMGMLVAGDQLYKFVLLLQYATPSAILLGAVASLRGYAVKEASALLFWQHICAVGSLSLYVVVFFKLLLSYT
ncbi:Protein PIN-LIKES 2 [Linum grandiflorum]